MSSIIIELSSDDENCIKNNESSDSNSTIDTDIATLLSKYKNVKYDVKLDQEITSNRWEDFNHDIHLSENCSIKTNLETISNSSEESNSSHILKNEWNLDVESKSLENYKENYLDEEPKTKKSKTKNNEDKILKKLEKEREKTRKQAEREQIKTANATAKAEKQQLASAFKNLKPDECIKFITTLVDTELMSSEMGIDIPNVLQSTSIAYKISSNILSYTVTWTRKNQPHLINTNQLAINNNEDCDEVLLFIMWNDFVLLVHENKLTTDLKMKTALLIEKRIYLGIYGLENYFRFYKSQKQKVTGKDKKYAESPKISRKDVDMALIELQLLYNISHRFLETPQDVSAMVLQFTKSVSQIPYKKHKEQKNQQMDWYISGNNKDSVRVDKNGNGLHRLWQQQITQFTLARLETAEAITSVYPSPRVLIEAYDKCTKEEGLKLLQDIPIRRAAGPLTTVRKIGPELSKKMYHLFASIDGNEIL